MSIHPTALLVMENRIVAADLAEELGREGYLCLLAEVAELGALLGLERPDLAVLDVDAGFAGVRAAAADLRRLDVPFLYTTAGSPAAFGQDLPPAPIIEKPFDSRDLVARLGVLMPLSRSMGELPA